MIFFYSEPYMDGPCIEDITGQVNDLIEAENVCGFTECDLVIYVGF